MRAGNNFDPGHRQARFNAVGTLNVDLVFCGRDKGRCKRLQLLEKASETCIGLHTNLTQSVRVSAGVR